jgi:hypothetical protein
LKVFIKVTAVTLSSEPNHLFEKLVIEISKKHYPTAIKIYPTMQNKKSKFTRHLIKTPNKVRKLPKKMLQWHPYLSMIKLLGKVKITLHISYTLKIELKT